MLRKLTVDEALERLETQLPAYAHQNTPEVLLIHGKGTNSPGGNLGVEAGCPSVV